jgi:hypothetical protein
MANTFHKQERLSSRKQMEMLFAEGKSFSSWPVKIVFANSILLCQSGNSKEPTKEIC